MTMAELAKRLGVAQSTVSRALSETPGKIPAGTVARIRAAASEAGFVANRAAATLRTRRSGLIGVMLPAWSEHKKELGLALWQAAHRMKLTPMFMFYEGGERERRQALNILIEQNIEGLITIEARLLPPPVTLPLVNLYVDAPNVDCYVYDYDQSAREIFEHLARLGHRTLAYIGSDDPLDPKIAAFDRNLSAFGLELPPDFRFLYSSKSPVSNGGEALTHSIIPRLVALPSEHRPSALIFSADISAFIGIRLLHEFGFSVPGDFSVVSYNDVSEAKYFIPALTTVNTDHAGLADRLLKTLSERIRQPELPPRREFLHTELMIRESTGYYHPQQQQKEKRT